MMMMMMMLDFVLFCKKKKIDMCLLFDWLLLLR